MKITRRDFIRYASASAATLGLSQLQIAKAEEAIVEAQAQAGVTAANSPAVVWLSGSGCTGCSVSLMNAVSPTIDQVLLNTISLKYHSTLMAAGGEMAVAAAKSVAATGGHILVVEGAIPTGSAGRYCYVWDDAGVPVTMAAAVQQLAAKAKYIVAVGTCASFGGIPAAYSLAGAKGVGAFLGKQVVNLPGCPAHPDWIVGTLVQILGGTMPRLDSNRRPTMYYTSQTIHERCPRRDHDGGMFGRNNGGCLEELGCKGPETHADCDKRLWNNKQGYCIGVNGLCIGCVEPTYPQFPLHHSGDGGGGGDD